MRFLTVVFDSASELAAHYTSQGPCLSHGALFCPTKAECEPRDKVLIDISLRASGRRGRLSGRVISRFDDQGTWVRLDQRSEATANYLLGDVTLLEDNANTSSTTKRTSRISRAHSRYPLSLPVICRIDEVGVTAEEIRGRILDLSSGGAFVSAKRTPLVGTHVSLEIGETRPLARHGVSLNRVDGRVTWLSTWTKVQGSSPSFPLTHNQTAGFGVCFDRHSNFGPGPVRAWLRHASETGRLLL